MIIGSVLVQLALVSLFNSDTKPVGVSTASVVADETRVVEAAASAAPHAVIAVVSFFAAESLAASLPAAAGTAVAVPTAAAAAAEFAVAAFAADASAVGAISAAAVAAAAPSVAAIAFVAAGDAAS